MCIFWATMSTYQITVDHKAMQEQDLQESVLSQSRRQRTLDTLFRGLTRVFAFSVLAMLVGIIVSLVIGAAPAMKQFGFEFIWRTQWDPVAEEFGAVIPIFGTVVTSTIALVIAVPLSFGIAL